MHKQSRALWAALILTVPLGVLLPPGATANGVPAGVTAAAPPAVTFSSCTKVKKVSSGGIAESKAAARRVKGKQKVSARLYNKYRKWDRNKDGVICGPKDSTSKTVSRTGNGTVSCPDGMKLVGANAPALVGREISEWTAKLTPSSTSATYIRINKETGEPDFPEFTIYCRRF